MEPIQHPLSTQPGSASRPISSQRMSVIGESVSRACTWQHPVSSLPRQMIATPGMEVWPIHLALEGKIRFSARFRTERKAQAGIPALNQRGETRSLASQPATAPGPPERSRPPCALFSTPGPAHQTLHPRSWPRRLFGCCWEAWRDLTPDQGEPLQFRGAKTPLLPTDSPLNSSSSARLRPRPLLLYPPTLPRNAEA